jgi:hypothetical protein
MQEISKRGIKMAGNEGTLLMEDASIVFRNFAGKEGMYNAEGDRNFCVLLDDELAETLSKDGWNVKELRAREEGDTPQKYIQVSVKYRGRSGAQVRPPTIVMITSKGRTSLDENEAELLDWVDIAKTDLIVRPFQWAVNGKTGTKAYLKSIYITILEDALQIKYQELPELRAGTKVIAIENEDIWEAEVIEDEQKAIER